MAIVVVTGVILHRQSRRATLLERELHRSEEGRLRELNALMVGMAHEVRNPLNSIRLNLHTSDRIIRGVSQLEEQEVASMLSDSVREIERVESLIGQLLGYARMENECDDDVVVADEIQSAIQFMQPTFELQFITVNFRNHASSVNISIDRRRFRQILLNLMNNAVDAMPSGGHIELTLETNDNQARLTIADSGTGVDAKIRSRLFEPFVTTRESGTGMGLAIVRRIITSMDGAIQYQTSGSLGGAEFCLSFPVDCAVRRSKHGR
jgi:signal transduction histidine kinase